MDFLQAEDGNAGIPLVIYRCLKAFPVISQQAFELLEVLRTIEYLLTVAAAAVDMIQ